MSNRTFSRSFGRVAALSALATGALLAANAAGAQETMTRGGAFELRPLVGAYVPTGDQRDFLKDALLVGAQASWNIIPNLAVTGTLGWAPSKDRITAGDQKIDLWQYDVGAELRAPQWVNRGAWGFTPFAGLGLGARTYNYRDLDVDTKTNFAGYGAVGGEFGFGRTGVRLEARDYVSRFEPFNGGDAKTRNDITVAAGLTVRF